MGEYEKELHQKVLEARLEVARLHRINREALGLLKEFLRLAMDAQVPGLSLLEATQAAIKKADQ